MALGSLLGNDGCCPPVCVDVKDPARKILISSKKYLTPKREIHSWLLRVAARSNLLLPYIYIAATNKTTSAILL